MRSRIAANADVRTIIIFVVQLQRNGHANISCILSSVQSNTRIGQEVLFKRMTQNDSQFLLVGWTTNWLTYRRRGGIYRYPRLRPRAV